MKKIFLMPLLMACALMLLVSVNFSQTQPRQSGSLAETTWSGTDSEGDEYVFTFEKDGTLAYTSPSGSYRNGKWEQFGKAVYFHMNDHYSEYLGEMKGNVIKGRAWNIKGREWTWKVKKNKQ